MRLALICLAAVALCPALEAQTKKGTLYGTVVVIDPGHGGEDPGSSTIFNGKRVTEDEYVYDVARRVERLARRRQALTFLTVKGDGVRSASPHQIFPDARDEKFSANGEVVRAGSRGLNTRLRYGNSVLQRYPKHKRMWISIHFDVVGSNRDVDGVRIIHGKNAASEKLAKVLEKSFGQAGRIRSNGPIAVSGDKRYGLRNLFVLSSQNQAPAKVLIELGNFLNKEDHWRIRNPEVREKYALAIVEALLKY